MTGFLIFISGVVFGIVSVVCLALCSIQKENASHSKHTTDN